MRKNPEFEELFDDDFEVTYEEYVPNEYRSSNDIYNDYDDDDDYYDDDYYDDDYEDEYYESDDENSDYDHTDPDDRTKKKKRRKLFISIAYSNGSSLETFIREGAATLVFSLCNSPFAAEGG